MLHKKRITFTVIRFFVVSHREIRNSCPTLPGSDGGSEPNVSPVGCRRSRNEANESTETSGERAPSARSDD